MMTPHVWINNFSIEMEGKMPNPFIFAVMLSNNFNGKVFVCEDDFIVRINGEFYDFNGFIDSDDLNMDDYIPLDKLSLLENVKLYHYVKWWFVAPFVEDELYHINVN